MTASTIGVATVAAPTVKVGAGGSPLSREAEALLIRALVDTDLNRPGMFELTFLDRTADLVKSIGLQIGTTVQLLGRAVGTRADEVLMVGEVTSIEGRIEHANALLVVRGHDLCHRLQRVRRTRAYLNVTDSDIAGQLAKAAGITRLAVEPSTTVHDHIGQIDQTDWDFLKYRAREIGYEVGVSAGEFYFRKASSAGPAAAPVTLTFRQDLRRFGPRVSAGNLAPKAEVRVWDPLAGKVVSSVTEAATTAVTVPGHPPAQLAGTFVKDGPPSGAPRAGVAATGADLGPAPQGTAHVIFDRPVATGAAIDAAAAPAARALADRLAATFAEADGETAGNPKVQAGAAIQVQGVEAMFSGPWLITSAQHVFDSTEGGYTTTFVAGGRHDRSLLGLASLGAAQPAPPRLPGIYCGIVTNNNDPLEKGRVKLVLPWLSPEYETDWALVSQVGAGQRSGALFLPEVGDEVLVGFEFGDARRPHVLGGVRTNESTYSLGGPPVKATGESAAVVLRGLVSAAGNRLVFHDELPPGSGTAPPSVSAITLGTGDGTLAISIDQVAGTVTVNCQPAAPNSKSESGTINIRCGNAGAINIATGTGGKVAVDAGAELTLKAERSISIQSSGELTLKGSTITLN